MNAIKAIEAFFSNPDISSDSKKVLPTNLVSLVKQSADEDIPKLHEELLKLQKIGKENNVPDALFIDTLSLYGYRILNAGHLEQWFKAYAGPAIDSAGHNNDVVIASQNFIQSILDNGNLVLTKPADSTVTPSRIYFDWIFDICQGEISKYFELNETGLPLAERKRFIIQNARSLLLKYGRNHSKDFFTILSEKAFKPESRLVILNLSSELISHFDKEYLDMVDTPFLDMLCNFLLYDKSSTVIKMGINVISMCLPYYILKDKFNLPKLFVVLGRCSSWTAFSNEPYSAPSVANELEKTISDDQANTNTNWSVLDTAFDLPQRVNVDVSPLFCVLYGVFSNNILSFMKNPESYIEKSGYKDPLPPDFRKKDVQRSMKEVFKLFSLNPFLLELSAEEEIISSERLLRFDSVASIVDHCISLRIRDDMYMLKPPGYDSSNESNTFNTFARSRRIPNTETPFSPLDTAKDIIGASPHFSALSSPLIKSAISQPSNSHISPIPLAPKQPMDSLLETHYGLYRRSSADDNTPVHFNGEQAVRKRSIVSSPLLNPVSDVTGLSVSPNLLPQAEPSSSVTPVTVSSPQVSGVGKHVKYETESELKRLTPLTEPTDSVESTENNEQLKTFQKRIQSQQVIGSDDPYILFYQRELLLAKNEYDFVVYLERYSQHQYLKIAEEQSRDSIYNESVADLVEANASLRRRVSDLESKAKVLQNQIKEAKESQEKYKSTSVESLQTSRELNDKISSEVSILQKQLKEALEETETLHTVLNKEKSKTSQLEFKINDLEEKIKTNTTLKNSLDTMKKQIAIYKTKTEGLLTPVELSNQSKSIEQYKKTQMKHTADMQQKTDTILKLERQVAILKAALLDCQTKQKPSASVVENEINIRIQDLRAKLDVLQHDYANKCAKYESLDMEFKMYKAEQEQIASDNYKAIGNTPKSLLGFDIPLEDPTTGLNSSRSSTTGSLHSGHGASLSPPPNHTGTLPPQVPSFKTKPSQPERMKGRGGVQNSWKGKETASSRLYRGVM